MGNYGTVILKHATRVLMRHLKSCMLLVAGTPPTINNEHKQPTVYQHRLGNLHNVQF